MDVINFTAWIAQQKVLEATDIVPADDMIVVGKKVNRLRDGSEYMEFAMSIQDFFAATGNGYTTVQDEGVSLPGRSIMNFVGAGVTVTDAGGKTVVTIPTPPATPAVSLTYAAATALIASNSLIVGEHYFISDKADGGIMLTAVADNKFSLEGQGIFLNPDFQDVIGNNVGVWHNGLAGLVLGTSIAIWNDLQYTSVTGVVGIAPDGDAVNWVLIPKTNTDYIEEVDFILYDFDNDIIIRRMDKRSNDINADNAYFQWGNNNVQANVSSNSATVNCINQRGSLVRCVFENQVNFILDNTHEGDVTECTFGGKYTITANFTSGNYLKGCTIFPIEDIIFDSGENHEDYSITPQGSTFTATLNMTDGVDYDLATQTLTIPTIYNYCGIFNLQNNSGATITKIINMPLYTISRFNIKGGHNFIFNHTSIAVAVAGHLVSDAAAPNTIVGRIGGLESDFIEYESRNGSMNRRYNAVILL
jgi:hypothetical protein